MSTEKTIVVSQPPQVGNLLIGMIQDGLGFVDQYITSFVRLEQKEYFVTCESGLGSSSYRVVVEA